MANRIPMGVGELYHCYNRGVDKRVVFQTKDDFERFQTLLFLCNGEKKHALSDRKDTSLEHILSATNISRGDALVEIASYAMMSNHVHLVLREIRDAGIALFMQKVLTGYTMYFNKKYGRTGPLFSGAFKSRHIDDDVYFKHVMAYVLLNPVEIDEPEWKKGKGDITRIEKKIMSYQYASTMDFFGHARMQGKILNFPVQEFYDRIPHLETLLKDLKAYYASLKQDGR